MKSISILTLLLLLGISNLRAQDHAWSFGFYGDVQLQDENFGSFGIQGKYDFDGRSGVHLLVNGRKDYVAVEGDYVFNLLDKFESNFNVFLAAGLSQDFFRREIATENGQEVARAEYERFTLANAQIGASYYFPEVEMSLFTGYKVKYQFDGEHFEPNFVMFGLRYHLW